MLYELMLRYLTSHFIRNYDNTFFTITLLILRKKFSFGLPSSVGVGEKAPAAEPDRLRDNNNRNDGVLL